MEKKTKIIIGVGFAVAAIGGFFWWKNNQAPETNADGSGEALPPTSELPPTIPDGAPIASAGVSLPPPDDKIKLFQDWMDKNHPNWVKATNATLSNGKSLNKGAGYGNNGSSTTKAMAKYGSEYNSKAKSASGGVPKAGTTLYTANKDVVLYSDASTKKAIRVIRNTPDRIGLFKRPSSVKGWWLITAPNPVKMKNEDVYIKSSEVTTVPR